MLFHSLTFWIFLPIVLIAFYATPLRIGRLVLLAASYVFYMWWNPWLVSLIAASTALDYWVGARLAATDNPRRRRTLLATSVAANLGLLCTFKYLDFFTTSFALLFGIDPSSVALHIVLPVGISFYTFQSMSYTIDIYRRQLAPVKAFSEFALYVAFFPQLVAGPIVRARTFLPQLANWRPPDAAYLKDAVHLVLLGLVKKLCFADQFGIVSDGYFADVPGHPGSLPAVFGILSFTLQVYFDFSGYTDIARGVGKLFGFDFPLNFARPYLAASFGEFWRRWHISLSRWLHDYLYVPLGGNRGGAWKTYRNLMLTMLLGGLWHGAGGHFVVWGGVHGLYLAAERALGGTRLGRELGPRTARGPWRIARVVLTFALFNLALILFRANSLAEAMHIFGTFGGAAGAWTWEPFHAALAGASLVVTLGQEYRGWLDRLATASFPVRVAYYAALMLMLELFSARTDAVPFLYFQF
ncbi:MBOAT family protein [bacterium]|nr:MBOAT family protein [bacterium]